MRVESTPSGVAPANQDRGTRAVWRAVAIPTEHGGWGLTAEPILLGLVVAFSWAGAALGAAALAGFLLRTPLKIVLIDRRRHRWLPRTSVALRITLVELVLIMALALGAGLAAGWSWVWPVAAAVPLVAGELWFDIRSRSRRLIPELCGGVGIAASAAAIVLIGGGATALAIGVWLVIAGRGIASISFVRTQIQRLHRGAVAVGATTLLQLVGGSLGAFAVLVDRSFVIGAAALTLLVVGQVGWLYRPVPPAKVLGIRQMVFGFSLVGATAVGVLVFAA